MQKNNNLTFEEFYNHQKIDQIIVKDYSNYFLNNLNYWKLISNDKPNSVKIKKIITFSNFTVDHIKSHIIDIGDILITDKKDYYLVKKISNNN